MNQSDNTLEWLNLRSNHFGDVDLDKLVLTLRWSRKLTRLVLSGCEIGLRGCTSLARLLKTHEFSLRYLNVKDNSINDESAIILTHSLAKNIKLKWPSGGK